MSFEIEVAKYNPKIIELYQVEYENGTFDRFTNYGRNFIFQGNTYYSIDIERDSQEQEASLKVGTIRVSIGLGSVTRSMIDLDAIKNEKALDRAELKIFQVSRDDPVNGWRLRFNGFTGLVEVNNLYLEAEFKDIFFLFSRMVPVDLFGVSCQLVFGSTRCTLDKEALKLVGTAEAGSDKDTIVDASMVEAAGYYDRGYIVMTSGNLSGLSRPVSFSVVGSAELAVPYREDIQVGNTFKLYPHCQKQQEKCIAFGNGVNHFAFRTVPKAEEIQR